MVMRRRNKHRELRRAILQRSRERRRNGRRVALVEYDAATVDCWFAEACWATMLLTGAPSMTH